MLVSLTSRLNSYPNSLGDGAKAVFYSRQKLRVPRRLWPCLIEKLNQRFFLLSVRPSREGRRLFSLRIQSVP
jgi:hypothetical protein